MRRQVSSILDEGRDAFDSDPGGADVLVHLAHFKDRLIWKGPFPLVKRRILRVIGP